MYTYIVVGVEHLGNILGHCTIAHGLDIVTTIEELEIKAGRCLG